MSRPATDSSCPHCGAAHEPGQEYCLECGSRLQPAATVRGRLGAAWRDRLGWYPGDWIWPALLALLVAVAGAVAAIALSDAGADSGPIVATQGGPAHMPTTSAVTATVALPQVPAGTPTAPPTGPPSTPTQPPPAATSAAPPGSLASWPGSRSGFTIIVESIPRSSGRTLALARAREASRAGLPEVGILDSSRYSSLHPGYYVVFSGVYSSQGAAEEARTTASSKGFASAYTKEITP